MRTKFCTLFLFLWSFSLSALLPTYFTYTPTEIAPLRTLNSAKKINENELKKWDQIVSQLVEKEKMEEVAPRLYAYLYVAQRDLAYLSSNVKADFQGSVEPISLAVVQLFVPSFNRPLDVDDYTKELTKVVFSKIQTRFQEEESHIQPRAEKIGEQYWPGKVPYFGIKMGSWMPWIIPSADALRAAPPPVFDSPEWQNQINEVKTASKDLTEEQKQAILFWADQAPGKFFKKDDWLDIANTYMWAKQTPLISLLLIRSTLAMALEDGCIAVFDSKYTYWVKRPFMRDPSIKPFIEPPNHPSYPAGHATLSFTASPLLIHFFPDDEQLWNRLAHQGAQSRIWAGIHFPVDNEAGRKIGENIAAQAIEKLQEQKLNLSRKTME